MTEPRSQPPQPASRPIPTSGDDVTALLLRLAASAVTLVVAVFLTLVR